ncbi:MAG: RpiB/LacA/LacB family sugar-phosphate isomerase [Brumimicrobium sp.]|nr:RpiB/LacA/LacB family sugar-phosphate isomerase [Brumimicrobium sp.]
MNKDKVIPIGADHAGYELKNDIINHFTALGYSFKDYGCYSDESVDYPDFGHAVASHVEKEKDTLGIVICGSGNGINMSVNKHQGVRGALCWNFEIAELARQHNNANIISLPARFVDKVNAFKMVETFLDTEFEGGRHERRVNKIACS